MLDLVISFVHFLCIADLETIVIRGFGCKDQPHAGLRQIHLLRSSIEGEFAAGFYPGRFSLFIFGPIVSRENLLEAWFE